LKPIRIDLFLAGADRRAFRLVRVLPARSADDA
jgi:hypothetical protein